MVSQEQADWWAAFVERVSAEAHRRGGSAYRDQGIVRLVPPDAGGEAVEVVQFLDDGLCRLTAGFVTSVMSFYTDYEDHNGVLSLVLAVMDGRGQETVTVAPDGSWLGAHSVIDAPGRRVRSDSRIPPHSRRGIPVAHSHVRVIEAWGH